MRVNIPARISLQMPTGLSVEIYDSELVYYGLRLEMDNLRQRFPPRVSAITGQTDSVDILAQSDREWANRGGGQLSEQI